MSDESAKRTDVYISKKHNTMVKALVPDFFAESWELLCFGASIGWKLQAKRLIPTKGEDAAKRGNIQMNNPGRGDALMADLIGVLESQADDVDDPSNAALTALSDEHYSERCRKLNAYAHGGFAYVEEYKVTVGTYRQTIEKIIEDGEPDPEVLAHGAED